MPDTAIVMHRVYEFRVRCPRCGFDNAYHVRTHGTGPFPRLENPEPPHVEPCYGRCGGIINTYPLTALANGQAKPVLPDIATPQ